MVKVLYFFHGDYTKDIWPSVPCSAGLATGVASTTSKREKSKPKVKHC